ncbi:MAG: GatB/YqeY domain-containing protein [Thermostichus sp. HHBFW_bins_43]
MSLRERIDADLKAAMKAKDKTRLETVRSIKKVILEKESSVRASGQTSLTPEQELELLSQLAKQRRDAIQQYQQAQREDLAEQERQELAILEEYLPRQLTDAELDAVLDQLITDLGAKTPKDMGKVMSAAMQHLKGQADGKRVQERVKAKLTA